MTLMEEAPKVMANPNDYNARANIMWAATVGLNGWLGLGVPQDWATHLIGHEITALHGLDHGVTLAIVMPTLIYVMRESKHEKILQYAERVLGITEGDKETRVDQAIDKTRAFFESLGVKTHLRDYGIKEKSIDVLLSQLEKHGMTALGEGANITLAKGREILENCL